MMNSQGRPNVLDSILPTLMTFGPIFMVIGLESSGPGAHIDLTAHIEAYGGALVTATASAILFTRQQSILRRLDALEAKSMD